jgi:VIT1/CCC1 family predicted Fe2+/Mn2+ transporter
MLGVAAAHPAHGAILVAGISGLAAGAMSMAAGEYVSVHSQKDAENADLERERAELKTNEPGERAELTTIYIERGLEPTLARQVAVQLMAHDALGAHARDELGHSEALRPRPLQAAMASAVSFAAGAAMPLAVALLVPGVLLMPLLGGSSLIFLAFLGGLAARVGGAGVSSGALRVTVWGAIAMAVTSAIGRLFGTLS